MVGVTPLSRTTAYGGLSVCTVNLYIPPSLAPLYTTDIMFQLLLRDAAGSLAMQGCTGGTFLSERMPALKEWVTLDGPYFYIDFSRAPLDQDTVPPWDSRLEPFLPREEYNRELWWLWDDQVPTTYCRRPPWWSYTNMYDAKVFIHSTLKLTESQ